jgi:hypothetical protein
LLLWPAWIISKVSIVQAGVLAGVAAANCLGEALTSVPRFFFSRPPSL